VIWLRALFFIVAVQLVSGAGLWTGAVSHYAYALFLALSYHLFVRYHEEPRLRRGFGSDYADCCAGVPRWWPRASPWRGRRSD